MAYFEQSIFSIQDEPAGFCLGQLAPFLDEACRPRARASAGILVFT